MKPPLHLPPKEEMSGIGFFRFLFSVLGCKVPVAGMTPDMRKFIRFYILFAVHSFINLF